MKHVCTLISVADINASRKFYEDLFGLEVFQDYGRNIAFTCGLALQQDFDWLVDLPKEKVLIMAKYRAIPQGFMTVGEVAKKMGVSVGDAPTPW